MKEISFEMATELGIIPRPTDRYTTFMFPFESAYGYEKRCEQAELSFRAEIERIETVYQYVFREGEKLKVV